MRDLGRGRREGGRAPKPGTERHNSSQAKGDWMKELENEGPGAEGSPQKRGRGTHSEPGKWKGGVSATRDAGENARAIRSALSKKKKKKSRRGKDRRGWSFLQLKVKVLRRGDSWSGGRQGRRSSPAPALGSSLGLSPFFLHFVQ